MKKILFILPCLTVGGLERVQVTIANSLAKKGYDVTVMALDTADDLVPELDKKVHYIHKPYKPHKIMKRVPYIRHKFYDDGMWETRASAKTLYKYYVGNEKYDVEIAFFRGLPVKILSGSTNKNAIHLAWVHSDFRKANGYLNSFKSLNSVKKAYESYDNVICVSKQAEEGFKKTIGNIKNTKVIYNILPADEIKEKATKSPEININKSSFHIVLVARLLDSAKGQKRLISVVSKLHNESKDISLALIGSGGDERMLNDEVSRLKAKSYITITGGQINPYPYIRQADLLVCASFFEGYNLTVAEALILGVPVLSTNCAGPNEILDYGKYGMIVDNSEEGLYNGIRKLLENPDLLNEYREKTMFRQDFFNEDNILKQITELF